MQIWAIGIVRNEGDIIRVNVLHHLSQGIDRFLLLDDGSSDHTADVLADLSREHPVDWRRSTGAFDQRRLLTALAREASTRGADWVIPIDADEFWWAPDTNLRDVLASSDAGALVVDVVNFIQRREQATTTPDALMHMTRRVPQPFGPVERNAELVESDDVAYVEIVYHPKWISRASDRLEIGWGNHDVANLTAPPRHATGIVCLHAPLRSKAVLHQKLDRARPPLDIRDYLEKAWHLRRWRRLAAEGGLDAEWCANSYADDALDVHGSLHPLVADFRLRDVIAPWVPADLPRAERPSVTVASLGRSVRGRIVGSARSIDGWMDDDEADLLIRTVEEATRRSSSPHRIVEVGSYCGRSTIILGGAVRALGAAATVYAVDPHGGEVGAIDSAVGMRAELPTLERFLANVHEAGLDGIVQPIVKRSVDVDWREPISLLFIDGLHDYLSVRDDVNHFAPWVMRRGLIVFHDHEESFPGVRACVSELLATTVYEAREQCGSLLVMQKVGDDVSVSDPPRPVIGEDSAGLRSQIAARDDALRALRRAVEDRERSIDSLRAEVQALRRSRSWRLTAPLRALQRLILGR